ncbi:MAG TPA: glycine cleavage T C-terminal barrel domain-containing protein, partial [Rudaea sp.]|nr:glycine cleavage T C-terminal barrel domain-containing protein [Rudaea sp.]
RYGAFAAEDSYLKDMTRQFYARRFVISYPNEELPAGRPLKVSPCHDALKAEGALYGCTWGMETPQFFTPGQTGFVEQLTVRRSNAHDFVAAEVRATREAAGMFESAVYARYEVSGPGAAQWLDHLLASRLPRVGRVRLTPMLSANGKLMGDLTVSRLTGERFWLIGSYYLQAWHMRWFDDHLPQAGVTLRNLSDHWTGFAMSGPASREIISCLTDRDMSNAAFPFLSCAEMPITGTSAVVARLSLTGELGFEINVPVNHQLALYAALKAAGKDHGLRSIGNRALDSLRLEKSYGIWNSEFTQSCTPGMSNLARHVAFDKGDFIGRDAALRERETGASKTLVTLRIDAGDADASGFEPVKCNGKLVGCVTSGAYGHYVKQSLALAYVDRDIAIAAPELTVDVIGESRTAKILPGPAYDPKGLRLRS